MSSAPTISDLREATQFTRAPLRRGMKPFAAPKSLNRLASRFEDVYLNLRRDGPRRLDEQPGQPYWATLPKGVSHPISNVTSNSVVMRHLRDFAQSEVDATVGLFAVVLALYHCGRLRPQYAQLILGHHALQIVNTTFWAMGPGVGLMLILL